MSADRAMTAQEDEDRAARAIEAGAYDEAIRLLKPLAERNSEYALLALGWIYDTGAAGVPDKDAARIYYEHVAAQGGASGHLYLGWLLLEKGEHDKAREAFEAGARLDDEECRTELMRLDDADVERLAGQAIEKEDYAEAFRLLQPLAERGSEYTLLTLGYIHRRGIDGAPDWDSARSYFERAAAEGSVPAHHYLGRLFMGRKEDTKALEAFRAGAELGDLPCMSDLGRMLVKGRGGPVDLEEGREWLEKAAAKGHFFAQRAILALRMRNTRSLLEKLSVWREILLLGVRAVRKACKDPHSDKIR